MQVWVLVVFVLSRKWKKVPHFFTMCLAISQCVACIGKYWHKIFIQQLKTDMG